MLTSACNFTKSNTTPWVFFTFLKLYKWCKITESVSFWRQKLLFLQILFSAAKWRRKVKLGETHLQPQKKNAEAAWYKKSLPAETD